MKLNFSQPRPLHRHAAQPAFARAAGHALVGHVLVAGLAFTAMAPVVDGIQAVAAQAQKAAYSTTTDPLQPDSTINGVAALIMASAPQDARGRVAALFNALKTSSRSGLKVVNSEGRPPNTAAEAIRKGGDCTEFGFVILAAIKAMNYMNAGLDAEVQVVHFRNSPPGRQHMLVSVGGDSGKIPIDPQATALGATKDGAYDVVLRLAPDEAAAIYHQEWGEYFSDRKMLEESAAAYERATEIYGNNAEAQKGAAAKYERLHRWGEALRHYRVAVAMDTGYARDTTRMRYYLEYEQGEKAADRGAWGEGATHFRNALGSLDSHPFRSAGEEAAERADAEKSLGVCERNAAKSGQ